MHRFLFTACVAFFLVTVSCALAQARQISAPASEEDQGPVPVPEPGEKAVSYYTSGNALWVVNQLWALLIPALFLFSGFSARIRDWL